jgi:hypothetical protein
MNFTLSFRNVSALINAFEVVRNHGIDASIAMSGGFKLVFHDDDEQQLAAAILPSFGIKPIFN